MRQQGRWKGPRDGAVVLLMTGAIACGRIGFSPSELQGDGLTSSGGSGACAAVDNTPPARAFDCATIEGKILAGNIASISDADLIAWAQNDCMLKPAPAFATAPPSELFPVTAGTGPSCSAGAPPGAEGTAPNYTYTGSGTLDLGSFTGSCGGTNLLGTYDDIHFATISTSASVNTSYEGCRAIHVDRLSGTATLRAYDFVTALASAYPVQFRLNAIENTSQLVGSSGDDFVVVTGNVGGNQIATLAGDDTVVIGAGLLADDTGNTFLELGDGNDTAYVKELGIPHGNPDGDINGGLGADHIYFNTFTVEDISGEQGDDVLSCTGLFGVPSCAYVSEWAFVDGNAGNDIISIDGPMLQTANTDGATHLDGGAGFNIIYVKSISNTTNTTPIDINVTNTGSSLLVIGGDHITARASTLTATGAGNVLLVKSGATNTGFTFTGFARTLSY